MKQAHPRLHQRSLGFVLCLQGRFEEAADQLADAASLTKTKWISAGCSAHVLEAAAAFAAMTDRLELGAELLAAADRIRRETGDEPRPWERAVRTRWLPMIPARLEPAVYAAATERGRTHGFPDALDFAEIRLRGCSRRNKYSARRPYRVPPAAGRPTRTDAIMPLVPRDRRRETRGPPVRKAAAGDCGAQHRSRARIWTIAQVRGSRWRPRGRLLLPALVLAAERVPANDLPSPLSARSRCAECSREMPATRGSEVSTLVTCGAGAALLSRSPSQLPTINERRADAWKR
jgi:hypothetical protein